MIGAFAFPLALILDTFLGDPRWSWHPVRCMGRLALWVEPRMRAWISEPRLAGVAAAAFVLLVFVEVAGLSTYLATCLAPAAGLLVATLWLYATVAPHDLARHARAVAQPLVAGDLDGARQAVGMIVGRDTEVLDESGVTRAAVESVAENLVDGVTAALFWALVGGLVGGVVGVAVGAILYRTANTLDATFGYKNERYLQFGWAAARWDDVLTYVPARVTAPSVVLAAALLRERPLNAWRLAWRDHANHTSPNSGWAEAVVAGALGVQLGGPTRYRGDWADYPTVGDALETLAPAHISRAVRLMLATTWFCVVVACLLLLVCKG